VIGVYEVGVDSYCSEYMKYVRRGFDTPVAAREERSRDGREGAKEAVVGGTVDERAIKTPFVSKTLCGKIDLLRNVQRQELGKRVNGTCLIFILL